LRKRRGARLERIQYRRGLVKYPDSARVVHGSVF
jgi:hypothetical protein